jgi:hypothetical protein
MNVKVDDLKQNSQRRLLSIHGRNFDSIDEGITVDDEQCWKFLHNFFITSAFRKTIDVKKSNSNHKEVLIGKFLRIKYVLIVKF